MGLKEVWRQVEDSFGYMNEIGDNDDFGNVIVIWDLVNTAPNSKQFSFSTGDMNCMVDSLGNRSVMSVHV